MGNAELERAKIFGDELTKSVDAFVTTFELTPEQHAALSDMLAAIIGRATSMAAGAVVPLDNKIERMAHARIVRIHELQGDVDRLSARIHALEDEFLDSGTVGQLSNAVAAMALEVEAIKTRQVGHD